MGGSLQFRSIFMRFLISVLPVALAHGHHNTCKIQGKHDTLVGHVAALIDCIPTNTATPFASEKFTECTESQLGALDRVEEQCLDCLTHYVTDHLPEDSECWMEYLADGDKNKAIQCIHKITKSLTDACFVSS